MGEILIQGGEILIQDFSISLIQDFSISLNQDFSIRVMR
jgi:hypothetical protein